MNLYEINADLMRLLEYGWDMDCIDPETGEILEDKAKEKLESLKFAEADKLENTALYIKNLTAEVEALKTEEKAMNSRRKAKEKKLAWLKVYLDEYMQGTGKEKFETARCALSYRKSEALEIIDKEAAIRYAEDHDYLKYKEPEIDKTALKRDIKAGCEVAGVALVTRKNLQIK